MPAPSGTWVEMFLEVMKKLFLVLPAFLLSALLLLESCSPFTKVYSEEEPGVNLYKYHTYNWSDNPTTQQGNSGPEWLTSGTQAQIRAAVEDQMSRFGYHLCTENPHLVLHYHVVIKNEVLFTHDWSCAGVGEHEGQYGRCNRVRPVYYREGSLLLDFIDTQTGNQVWRGAAVGILENITPKQAEARIQAAAQAIFKKFPEKPIPNAVP